MSCTHCGRAEAIARYDSKLPLVVGPSIFLCTTLLWADVNPPLQDVFLQDVALSKVKTGRVHQANHYIQARHYRNDIMVMLLQVL